MRCNNNDGKPCGLNGVNEAICCLYCEHNQNCKGLCIDLEFKNPKEWKCIVLKCSDFDESEVF